MKLSLRAGLVMAICGFGLCGLGRADDSLTYGTDNFLRLVSGPGLSTDVTKPEACRALAWLTLDHAQNLGDLIVFKPISTEHCPGVSPADQLFTNPIDVTDIGSGVKTYRAYLYEDGNFTLGITVTDYRGKTGGKNPYDFQVEEYPLDASGSRVVGAEPTIWRGSHENGPGGSGAHA